jgi:hypothetical protein
MSERKLEVGDRAQKNHTKGRVKGAVIEVQHAMFDTVPKVTVQFDEGFTEILQASALARIEKELT